MLTKLANKRVVITLTVVVLVILVTRVINVVILLSRPPYVGADAKLSKSDDKASLQIDNAVISTLPKIKSGVEATFQITKFDGNYAQGVVTYSDKSLTQQFMGVKVGNIGRLLHITWVKV
jgi:hypothetical protein